jgi:hypothetical protein
VTNHDGQEEQPQVGLDVLAFISAGRAADSAMSVSLDNSRVRSLIELHKSRVSLADVLELAVDPDGERGLNVIALVEAYHYANSLARDSMEQIGRLQAHLDSQGGE